MHMQTEPVSPTPLRRGNWMVVPAVSPPPPPAEARADVAEQDKQGMYTLSIERMFGCHGFQLLGICTGR